MILQYLLIDNIQEIEQAERLGMKVPEQKYVKRNLVIDINEIQFALITKDGYIEITFYDFSCLIEYNQVIWDKIVNIINERERNRKDTE